MSRSIIGLTVLVVLACGVAPAQSRYSEPRGRTFSQGGGWRYAPREHHVVVPSGSMSVPWFPAWGFGGYPTMYGAVAYPGYYWPYPLRPSEMPGSPLTPPADALPAQGGGWGNVPTAKSDPALRPVLPSSAAARLKALNSIAEGDQQVRMQRWQHAYASYRQAVNQADDLAEAHLRSGIVYAALSRYDRAALEFRRAVHVDPSLPQSDWSLEKLFGPEGRLSRASLISRLMDWANEDIADPERLYVMGVMLHFNRDERADEFFSAAARLTNNAEHVMAFLPPVQPANGEQPAKKAAPGFSLPPAPLPDAQRPGSPPPGPAAAEAPPRPMLEENVSLPAPRQTQQIPPRAPAIPHQAAPKTTPKPQPNPTDGPVLLPPSPQ